MEGEFVESFPKRYDLDWCIKLLLTVFLLNDLVLFPLSKIANRSIRPVDMHLFH